MNELLSEGASILSSERCIVTHWWCDYCTHVYRGPELEAMTSPALRARAAAVEVRFTLSSRPTPVSRCVGMCQPGKSSSVCLLFQGPTFQYVEPGIEQRVYNGQTRTCILSYFLFHSICVLLDWNNFVFRFSTNLLTRELLKFHFRTINYLHNSLWSCFQRLFQSSL